MAHATHTRTLQFVAGPNEYEFAACDACLPNLASGQVQNFFARKGDPPPTPLDPDDERECDLCREGGD